MEMAAWFAKVFGERYYIEIQDNGLEIQRVAMEGAVEVARRMGLPLVATSDVHYVDREDAEAQDILLCINTGKFRTDAKRMRMETNEFYLRSPEEMYAAFGPAARRPSAARRRSPTASTWSWSWASGTSPSITPAGGQDVGGLSPRAVPGGARRSATRPAPSGSRRRPAWPPEVMDRLDRELGVINKLGFPNYFLSSGISSASPAARGIQATARGSGVGSLVAYALHLSHVCPLEFDLLVRAVPGPRTAASRRTSTSTSASSAGAR